MRDLNKEQREFVITVVSIIGCLTVAALRVRKVPTVYNVYHYAAK